MHAFALGTALYTSIECRPRISRLTKYKFSSHFGFKNYFFDFFCVFATNFLEKQVAFSVETIYNGWCKEKELENTTI